MTLLLPPTGGGPREFVSAINAALKGKINSTGTVTLGTATTSTTVINQFVGTSSVIVLFPQTAHAAAAFALGTIYIDPADYVNGESFIIHHTLTAQVDQVFSYVILG